MIKLKNLQYFLPSFSSNYACVRGYSNKTGSYTLKIEPNQDKTSYKNYGVWDCQKLSNSCILSGVWTSRKIYINKYQAILYYWTLDPATTISSGGKSYTMKQLKTLYQSNPSTAVNIMLTAVSSVVGIANTTAGITISIAGLFISECLSNDKSPSEAMRERLVTLCGVKHNANTATWTGKWSSTSGMLITETFSEHIPLSPYQYSYSKFTGGQLTGTKWCYGIWSY